MRKTTASFLTLLFMSLVFTGCKNQDIQNWHRETGRLRTAAIDQISRLPYAREQHLAFKTYFTSLGSMALFLRQDESKRQQFNEAIATIDLARFCGSLFMPEEQWRGLMENCTKNRFFLCAEEVRGYPDFKRALRQTLKIDLRARFDATKQCQE